MSYWDTSTLVKLYANEPDSGLYEQHLITVAVMPITSRIALLEAQATFDRKQAEGLFQPVTAEQLCSEMLQDVSAGTLRLIELRSDVVREYVQVLHTCYNHTPVIPLRTLDALHLASARVSGETEIVATDKRLRDAAKMLGFSLFPV